MFLFSFHHAIAEYFQTQYTQCHVQHAEREHQPSGKLHEQRCPRDVETPIGIRHVGQQSFHSFAVGFFETNNAKTQKMDK
jgi:hypothetical protein